MDNIKIVNTNRMIEEILTFYNKKENIDKCKNLVNLFVMNNRCRYSFEKTTNKDDPERGYIELYQIVEAFI